MNITDVPLLLAEIAAEDQELSVGAMLAGSCVLAALAGSLAVLSVWRARYLRGESVIPAADRPLLRIPMPLLIFGLLIGVLMSVIALAVSMGTMDSAVRPQESAVENGDPETQDDEVADRDLQSSELFGALLRTVGYDVAMILMLGIPVLIVKLRPQPILNSSGIYRLDDAGEVPVGSTLMTDGRTPFAAPVSFSSSESVHSPVEAWQLGREFRFAAETCLAAWLPTAALKLTMIRILGEDSQHPFLELIMDGVGNDVLLLIAFTAVVLAPIMEELLYRVVILGGLLNHPRPTPRSTMLAIAVTSVLFAFAHGFPDSIALLPLAVAIGWAYHQRRSYRTVVLVHVLFNGFNIILAGLGLV